MNLILFEPDEIPANSRMELRDRRAAHIRTVLRSRPGDRLRVGAIRGPTGVAEVLAVPGDDAVELEVRWGEPPGPPPPVDLVLALPRPKALARTLRTAACLGVRRVDLVNSWRVDKSYFASHAIDPAALRRHLLVGCEQGATTWLPDIAVHRLLMPFIRGPLAASVADPAVRFVVAHPRAGQPVEAAVPVGSTARVVAAIGPERGWIDRELASFAELRGIGVSLGDRVLPVESAVTALLSQLELLRRLASPA